MLTTAQRVKCGKAVREFITLIIDDVHNAQHLSEEEKNYTLSQLLYELEKLVKPKEESLPEDEMNLRQVQVFEDVLMPFGVHSGKKIKDVPHEYLCHLFDSSPFMKKLRKYLEYCKKYRHRD